MQETLGTVIIVAAAVLAGILLLKILAKPIKKIFKFLLNTLLGFGILYLINLIGPRFGISVDINLGNCAIAAVFGVPGVLLMILIKIFFV